MYSYAVSPSCASARAVHHDTVLVAEIAVSTTKMAGTETAYSALCRKLPGCWSQDKSQQLKKARRDVLQLQSSLQQSKAAFECVIATILSFASCIANGMNGT